MTRVHVLCEGKTERIFVREVLVPHFQQSGVYLIPFELRTSKNHKGGVSTYGKIRFQVNQICKDDSKAWVTTLIDFYGLPKDFPRISEKAKGSQLCQIAEEEFQRDIGQRKFIANLVLHEFEALLFSNPDAFAEWFEVSEVNEIKLVRSGFASPEEINNCRETAPSKRLLRICKSYEKALHGSQIAQKIGLDSIRNECPHFNRWLSRIEDLGKGDRE